MIDRIKQAFDFKIYDTIGLCEYQKDADADGEFEVDIYPEFYDIFENNVEKLHNLFHSEFYTTKYKYNWKGKKIPISFSFWDRAWTKPITTLNK